MIPHLCPDELTLLTGAITLAPWRWFQWRRWFCVHAEMIRERRDDGGLDVACARCGKRVELWRKTR